MTYDQAFSDWRRQWLLRLIREAKGNRQLAADMAGVHRNTLYRMLAEESITTKLVNNIRLGFMIRNPEEKIYRELNGEQRHAS